MPPAANLTLPALQEPSSLRGKIATPNPARDIDKATLARLNAAFELEIASALSAFGFNPGDLNRSPELIDSAANFVRGNATYSDLFRLADTVVEGTVERVEYKAEGDGLGSSVYLTDLRYLKGEKASPPVIRQRSADLGERRRMDVEGDFQTVGQRVHVLLSRGLYEGEASIKGARGSNANTLRIGALYSVKDGQYHPFLNGMPPYEGTN